MTTATKTESTINTRFYILYNTQGNDLLENAFLGSSSARDWSENATGTDEEEAASLLDWIENDATWSVNDGPGLFTSESEADAALADAQDEGYYPCEVVSFTA